MWHDSSMHDLHWESYYFAVLRPMVKVTIDSLSQQVSACPLSPPYHVTSGAQADAAL
jgi:hypothetical protein